MRSFEALMKLRAGLLRICNSFPQPRTSVAGSTAGHRVIRRHTCQAAFGALNSSRPTLLAVQHYTNAEQHGRMTDYKMGVWLGLAAAMASLYVGAASMESENLREEADAQSKGSAAARNTPPQESPETVTEKFTEIQFPLRVRMSKSCGDGGRWCDGGVTYHLLGTAVRCMLGACAYKYARAYAVAVYIEEGPEARRWLPGDGAGPATSEALRRELLSAVGAGRMLRLVMDRDVEGHHIAKGFDRSLIPRVRERQGGYKKGEGKNALKQFTKVFFDQKNLKKGTKVELLWRPDNSLVTSIDGRVASVIHSPILCQSLFDVYFGPDNIFSKYNNTAFQFLGRYGDQV